MKTLFEPARIGTLQLKNRLIMPPMGTELADHEGRVTPALLEFYRRRGRGGAGLVTVEISAPVRSGINGWTEIAIWDDEFLPGLRSLASTIKEGGARAAIQLHHSGRQSHPEFCGGPPLAPSAIPCPVLREMPREATREEIQDLVEKFAEGARRAKEAGFDAVEFHGTHGYLISQFLSPLANQRTDEYGGDGVRRARFAVEIVRRTRQLLGPEFPLIFRISASDFMPDGLTLEDAKLNARLLEEAGVDAIHLSAGSYAKFERCIPPILIPRGHLVPYGAELKQVIQIPLIIVGNINRVSLAESVLREDKADFVAMGRPLIADPELPRKAMEGRDKETIRCITCNTCMDRVFMSQGIACLQNPEVGREELREEPAEKPERVLVRGDGPAALEAARVARLRGHDVQLFSAAARLGGRWSWMIDPFVSDKVKALRDLGIPVHLGRDLTPELAAELQPDVVVYQPESDPLLLDVPGGDQNNVVTADQVLSGELPLESGQTVVILGGGNVGLEVAEHLRRRAVRSIILQHGVSIGDGIERINRNPLTERLAEQGAQFRRGARAVRIDGSRVHAVDREGHTSEFQADYVVTALGYAQRELPIWLSGRVARVYPLGDCYKPRQVYDAIQEGAGVARQL